MKELKAAVRTLVVEELERANDKHPFFHSDHEGVAVVEEEKYEAKEEFDKVHKSMYWFKHQVFKDNPEAALNSAEILRDHAINTAAELIQTAAMCEKFIISRKERNENQTGR